MRDGRSASCPEGYACARWSTLSTVRPSYYEVLTMCMEATSYCPRRSTVPLIAAKGVWTSTIDGTAEAKAQLDSFRPTNCLEAAIAEFGIKVQAIHKALKVGSWSNVPNGCSVYSGGDFAAHFNTHSGTNNGQFTSVQASSIPAMFPPAGNVVVGALASGSGTKIVPCTGCSGCVAHLVCCGDTFRFSYTATTVSLI